MLKKTTPRDTENAALVNKTARVTGLCKKQVRRVIEGENENEDLLSVYMLLQEGNKTLIEEARKLWSSSRMVAAGKIPRAKKSKRVAA